MDLQTRYELRSRNTIPIIGLGTWELGPDTATIIADALQFDYPMIDTSGDYGTQPGIAEGLEKSGIPRESVYIVTKVEENDHGYDATQHNLSELNIDYADLVLIHRPPLDGVGTELWKQLIEARDDQLIKDIGVSNYSIESLTALAEQSGEMPAVNQIEWSPFGHDLDMLEFCANNDIVIQAYSPLTRAQRTDNQELRELAIRYGVSVPQLIIRWNLQMGVIPIVKASTISHLKENIDVFDFEISEPDMDTISDLNESYSALGGTLAYV